MQDEGATENPVSSVLERNERRGNDLRGVITNIWF